AARRARDVHAARGRAGRVLRVRRSGFLGEALDRRRRATSVVPPAGFAHRASCLPEPRFPVIPVDRRGGLPFPTALGPAGHTRGGGLMRRAPERPRCPTLLHAPELTRLDRVNEDVPFVLLQDDGVLVLADADRVALDDDLGAVGTPWTKRDPL